MATEREPIAVIGTGYVGLVTAAGFAELGSEVWCVDIDADKIARLEAGEVPIYEPGLEELLARHRERLHFSTELAPALEHARLLFVAVGTPPTYSGDADLSAVHAVVESMPPSDRHALVMKSTVPAGTGASIKRRFAEQGKDGFSYVSCPEFLKEGSAVHDFLHPDRVVVGDVGDWAGDAVVQLYSPLEAPIVRTDIRSAEMVKLASNAFLATKISFINEIANVCEETGADVMEVARGMGLDDRIGPKFLQAGIGFGGSCLHGDETVLVRMQGRTTLLRLEQLWQRLAARHEEIEDGVIEPDGVEVLSWVPGEEQPQFLPMWLTTRREYDGEMVEVRAKTGRSVRCTPDHPWIVGDGAGGEAEVKLAEDLTDDDWVPVTLGRAEGADGSAMASLLTAVDEAQLSSDQLIVRPRAEHVAELVARSPAERREVFTGPRPVASRTHDVKRSGALRLAELGRAGLPARGSTLATAKNGSYIHSEIALDEAFWRVVGLYLAEGCASPDDRGGWKLSWSFHPHREQHLTDEVAAFWVRHGARPSIGHTPTSQRVTVRSRVLVEWWMRVLGLGRNSYEQRLPDLIWDRPARDQWAVLSGLWEGDGSWSLVNRGPSVILEFGTVSDQLADGVMRLLAHLGVVAAERTGRVAKSTKDTHWIRISGADQVERCLQLVPDRDRPGVEAALGRQSKRIAPTGFRRFGAGPGWVRVRSTTRAHFRGPVYSMEVPYAHSIIVTDGLTTSNCFPKDVSALKQLAGNSGYHFQLLSAVIEVNELQKRRVVGKLKKHLGEDLSDKDIALLGLAFKPNTDDMREASSLVLAARLQADGAQVRAYDPVAEDEARDLLTGVDFSTSAAEALAGADAAVLVTEWPEFAELDWAKIAPTMRGRLVVDGRNFLDGDALRAAGLEYEGIGRR